MKAISLRQPSVEAILSGLKTVEIRGSSTHHRGDLVLHASRHYGPAERERTALLRERGIDIAEPDHESMGALCGIVRVVDCRKVTPEDWAQALLPPLEDGTYWAWVLAEPVRFPAPIPYKGRLFVFDVPDQLLEGRAPALTHA